MLLLYKARKSIFILLLIITSCLNIACFSSNISKNEEKAVEMTEEYKNWITFDIPNMGKIMIPPTLELQTEEYNDMSYKLIKQNSSGKNIEAYDELYSRKLNVNRFVFQQKGLNKAMAETKNIKNYNLLSDNAKKAFSEYARVCIDIIYGDTGVRIKDKLYLSREDLNELTEARINAFKQKTDGKIKLLDYEKAYVKNINGIDCIYFKYNSKYENNPMAVNEEYLFFNGDRCYQISILYRSTQKDIWTSESNDIRQTIKTIKFL